MVSGDIWRGGNLTNGSLVLSFSLLFLFADFFLNTVAGFSTSSSPNGARGAYSNPPRSSAWTGGSPTPRAGRTEEPTTSPTRTLGQASTKLGKISWPPIGWAHAACWISQCGAGVPRLLFAATLLTQSEYRVQSEYTVDLPTVSSPEQNSPIGCNSLRAIKSGSKIRWTLVNLVYTLKPTTSSGNQSIGKET